MKRTVCVAAVTALATLSVSTAADKSKDIVRYENAGPTPSPQTRDETVTARNNHK